MTNNLTALHTLKADYKLFNHIFILIQSIQVGQVISVRFQIANLSTQANSNTVFCLTDKNFTFMGMSVSLSISTIVAWFCEWVLYHSHME